MKLNYVLIPLVALLVMYLGGSFVCEGMRPLDGSLTGPSWYSLINKPSFTPSGGLFGAIWTAIFVFATIAALMVWNNMKHDQWFWLIMGIFILNTVLNVGWTYMFFYEHLIGPAVWEAGLLAFTVIVLILFIRPYLSRAAGFLAPYAIWTTFAVYLNYSIWLLNV